ncbi:MAG: helix-turn-helix domain-containing protein [Patescibacteria group bacterium]|mgnify:CR=1 FL=1
MKLITIKEAAEILGVTLTTLRRWDKNGQLPAIRPAKKSHRLYRLEDIEALATDLFSTAKRWVSQEKGSELEQETYCQNSSIFQVRLQRLEFEMTKIPALKDIFSLVSSTSGEIGNNSFDHNLGSWLDMPGIFFGYDLRKRVVVLADRGQGVLRSLKRVRPALENDEEALMVAFTEVVTGRAPEQRGNGLKYVRRVITGSEMELFFQTGSARLILRKGEKEIIVNKNSDMFVHGCLASIKF